MDVLGAMPVIVSQFALTYVWVFPKHRFFEWEPADEPFCRKFGIGHSEPKPAAFRYGNTWVMHPSIFAELQKKVAPENVIDLRMIPTVSVPRIIETIT